MASEFVKKVVQLPGYVKEHWNTTNPGEYLTLREAIYFCIGAMGINAVNYTNMLISFSAGYFCGSIMGISAQEFYIIGLMGTVLGYLFMFMNPIGVLIFENHGHLTKKTTIFALTFWILQLSIGIGLYFVPSQPFEGIIKGFPQLLANNFVSAAVGNLLSWLVRYKFSEKHGRVKPFLILYSVPTFLIMSIIPYLPVENLPHTYKLVILNLMYSFLGTFSALYGNYQGLIPLMSPNSYERQKIHSYGALPIGFASSIFNMFLPMLVSSTGGYLSLTTYRVFIPIMAFIGMALGWFMLPVKERVIENTTNRVKVKSWKAAKQVFGNKYWWITNVSNIFNQWVLLSDNVMNMFFIYSLRKEWLMGLASALISLLTSNISKLLVPTLMRRYEKRTLILVSRTCVAIFFACYFIAISAQSVSLLILFSMGRNFFNNIYMQVNNGLQADILDYHQWKTGERADSASTMFSWFTNPIITAVGYIVPAVLAVKGFTSNWDVLFDTGIFQDVMSVYVFFTIIGVILTTLPFIFYDLTKAKHDKCIEELKARIAEEETQQSGEENYLTDSAPEAATENTEQKL